jgi:hypothetical protein
MQIEIIPGESIGQLALGTPRAKLPSDVTIEHDTGTIDGIHFLIEQGFVHEIWIDDLRTLHHEVNYKGKTIDRQATRTQLQELFGPCSKVEQVLGGTRITCASGLQLGIGSAGPVETVQIRIRRE